MFCKELWLISREFILLLKNLYCFHELMKFSTILYCFTININSFIFKIAIRKKNNVFLIIPTRNGNKTLNFRNNIHHWNWFSHFFFFVIIFKSISRQVRLFHSPTNNVRCIKNVHYSHHVRLHTKCSWWRTHGVKLIFVTQKNKFHLPFALEFKRIVQIEMHCMWRFLNLNFFLHIKIAI